jgi:acetyl-CoA synthetase
MRRRRDSDWLLVCCGRSQPCRPCPPQSTIRPPCRNESISSADLRDYVGTRIGKFARPKRLIWTGELPKTRSGKITRRLLRDIAEGRDLGDVTTLADPTVVSALQQAAEGGK